MSHRFGSTELWRKCEWETFPVPKQNNTNTITIHNIKDLDGAASTAPPKTVPPVPKKNTADVTVPTNSTTNGTPAPSAPIKSALKQSLSRPKEPTAPAPSESIYNFTKSHWIRSSILYWCSKIKMQLRLKQQRKHHRRPRPEPTTILHRTTKKKRRRAKWWPRKDLR